LKSDVRDVTVKSSAAVNDRLFDKRDILREVKTAFVDEVVKAGATMLKYDVER
jgi:hypothetical protein